MRIQIYILTVLLFIGCKSAQVESEFPRTNTITKFYENGEIKSVGTIETDFLPFLKLRVGLWNEFYQNGKLKEAGVYKNDYYTGCGIAGPISIRYIYKYGEWIFYHENGQIKARGKFDVSEKDVKVSCGRPNKIKYGKINNNWKFYDELGNEIVPSKSQIELIENESSLTEIEFSD